MAPPVRTAHGVYPNYYIYAGHPCRRVRYGDVEKYLLQLNDPEQQTRSDAILQLGRLKTRRAIDPLTRVLANDRSLTTLTKTGIPGPEGSASKLVWSENNQRLTKLALEILGSHAQLTNGGGYADGYWQYQQLRSRGNTIEAGTSEILRNIVAERVLGLPRSR